MVEDIIDKQNKGIRIVILILISLCFLIGFYLIFINNNVGWILHLAGFIGLGWSYVLRKSLEKGVGE